MNEAELLHERQRDAESEVRVWLKRLIKRDVFVPNFADVQRWLWEEQTRVAGPPHQEFLTAALSANHRRDRLAPIRWRPRMTMLALMGWNLSVTALSIVGLSHLAALAGTQWISAAFWITVGAHVIVPLWCVWVWTATAG